LPSVFGQDRLTSTATTCDDLRRCAGERVSGAAVVVDRAAPDAAHDGGLVAQQRREVIVEPGGDTGTLEADGVDHPERRRMDTGRGVALPLEDRDRLGDDGADRSEIEVGRQLVAVTSRAGSGHDRALQFDRSDTRGEPGVRHLILRLPTRNHLATLNIRYQTPGGRGTPGGS
jgi:hypothetical protein